MLSLRLKWIPWTVFLACLGSAVSCVAFSRGVRQSHAIAHGVFPIALVLGYRGHMSRDRALVYAGQSLAWLSTGIGTWSEAGPFGVLCLVLALWTAWDGYQLSRENASQVKSRELPGKIVH